VLFGDLTSAVDPAIRLGSALAEKKTDTPRRNNMSKRTYQPSKIRRKRTHGFLVRSRTKGGQAMIRRRRQKGRKRLAL
jgi:large subunit ribosomal protein L34